MCESQPCALWYNLLVTSQKWSFIKCWAWPCNCSIFYLIFHFSVDWRCWWAWETVCCSGRDFIGFLGALVWYFHALLFSDHHHDHVLVAITTIMLNNVEHRGASMILSYCGDTSWQLGQQLLSARGVTGWPIGISGLEASSASFVLQIQTCRQRTQ